MYAGLESIPAEAHLILSRALEPVSPVGNRPKADAAPASVESNQSMPRTRRRAGGMHIETQPHGRSKTR